MTYVVETFYKCIIYVQICTFSELKYQAVSWNFKVLIQSNRTSVPPITSETHALKEVWLSSWNCLLNVDGSTFNIVKIINPSCARFFLDQLK